MTFYKAKKSHNVKKIAVCNFYLLLGFFFIKQQFFSISSRIKYTSTDCIFNVLSSIASLGNSPNCFLTFSDDKMSIIQLVAVS